MKKLTLTIILIMSNIIIFAQCDESCLPNGITFETQAGIDNFQSNFPECTEIEGDVLIRGDDITNLTGLNVLTAIGGDISIGNLATAKTVELPMMKMFQSYQAVWNGAYQDIDEIILEYADVPPEKWYIDRDFPPIAPPDVEGMSQALTQVLQAIPDLAYATDVKQMALLLLGINDPAEVLDALSKESLTNPSIALTKVLRQFKESLKND